MASSAEPSGPMRFKRPTIALLLVVVAVLVTLTIRATITVDTARSEVEDGLTALTGTPVRLEGAASARLLPWPNVRFDRVTLTRTADDRVVARMEALDVSLDVAALLLGRLRAEEVRLVHPEIHTEIVDPRPSPAAIADALRAWKPITVAVEKGRFVTDLTGDEETLDAVDARLSWPRPSANVQLRAGFRWRGESIGLDLESPSPVRLLDGEAGPASLRLTSAPLRLTLTGDAAQLLPFSFAGTGDLEIVDAARFSRWVGWPRTPDLLAGRFRLDGALTADPRGATLPNAHVDLAGNKAEGALTLRWDAPRPRLSGTIAFADLDLGLPRRRPWGSGWRTLPIDRADQVLDLDLRLSAPSVKMGDIALTRVGAALHVAEGRFRAEIGSAELYAKPVAVTVRGTLAGNGLEGQIRASADDLPLAEIAALLDVPGVDAGRASATLEGTVRCPTLGACAAATEGRLKVEAKTVKVTGASPFADMSRFRPIVPQSNGATVSTTWDAMAVDLRFAGPRADVDRVEISGQSARFRFSGKADLVGGGLDLTGQAVFPAFRPDPARSGSSDVAVPMRIGGTLRRLEAMARDAAPPPEAAPPSAAPPADAPPAAAAP
jgi:AsmA protein